MTLDSHPEFLRWFGVGRASARLARHGRRTEVRPTLRRFANLQVALLTFALSCGLSAAERLDRENLLVFRDSAGKVVPVRSTADWQKRRAEIVAAMQTVMGPLPGAEKRVPLEVKIESETDCGTYVRREITYTAEPGGRVPAFLLVPKAVIEGKVQRPGILAAMPTNNLEGNRPVVGLHGPTPRPGRNYGEELALRGFVVIVPPYPHLADYKPDLKGLGYASGTMKAIWDNIRALDVLAAAPGVSPRGFGAIGHSLGGHNSIYTAVFDERIKAIVSSCGFDSYLDYYAEKQAVVWRAGQGWTQERYMPALANYAGRLPEIPFDFHELIGALAPRAFLAISPKRDANFKWESVDRILKAARPVFQLHGVPERIAVEHPDVEHDFPTEMREKAYHWLEKFLP
jgi:dienelactone hydrolase